ncbi:hypothetical protein CNMCM8694_002300 [Aspergillus lentulus]|nr:hypothetical protein CNMCM8060_005497 [Aspergillus lentulus]KAF4191180.1 hypothetical protein CNMCM8694_002300 [Aspergillus lentulus]
MVVEGYDKLAAFLGSHPEFQYFRRFSTLNTKNLLYLQAELANLEQELQDIIQEDKELAAQEEKKRKYPFSVWHLKSSANDPSVDSYQWDKVKEVRELLHQYNAALLQQSQIMDFGAPAKVEAAGLREWLRRPECGGGSIQMLTEKDVWNEANEGDMIAVCRQQHEVDNFTKWVYTDFLNWFHNNWGHREKDKYDVEMGARIYDYHAIQSYTYAASILISGVLPASSIVVLYLLKGSEKADNLLKKWYQWYLREVESGKLVLPDYETNEDDELKIFYGELFCRVPDCVRAQKKYTATNNLRTHLLTHDGVKLEEGLVSGRVKQKEINEAIKFYKSLFTGAEPQKAAEGSASSTENASSSIPALPVKKDGTVHVTNMRKKVAELGHKVPCDSCGKRNDYFCPSPASHMETEEEQGAEA